MNNNFEALVQKTQLIMKYLSHTGRTILTFFFNRQQGSQDSND